MIYQPGDEIPSIRYGKPNIVRVWYPKSKRHYWRVSLMPKGWYDATRLRLWKAAHKFCHSMNDKIASQLELSRAQRRELNKFLREFDE